MSLSAGIVLLTLLGIEAGRRLARPRMAIPLAAVLMTALVVLRPPGSADLPRVVVAIVTGLTVILAWRPLAVADRTWLRALGVAVLAGGVVLQVVLLRFDPTDPLLSSWKTRDVWLASLLLLAEPATRCVRLVLDAVGPLRGPTGQTGAGEMIGILERWILVVLFVQGHHAAIGFVIAAKALARHKQMEEREFAEYFLVGTLASLLLALAVSVLVGWYAQTHATG